MLASDMRRKGKPRSLPRPYDGQPQPDVAALPPSARAAAERRGQRDGFTQLLTAAVGQGRVRRG